MSLRVESVNRFVNSMLDSEQKLKNGLALYDDKQAEIEKIIDELKESLEVISVNTVSADDTPEIAAKKKELFDSLRKSIQHGTSEIKENAKGMNFIHEYESTFVISVFGKVKSGKSSLGNFVMGSDIKKTGIETDFNKVHPVVNVYDRGKVTTSSQLKTIEENDDMFGVGSTETTSTIQYFKIGGMTWFDTPGIGSITKENEELAQEYIKNSDLVIFTCSSDAAGTTQEWDEMQKLSAMGKPILLLVTMSDTYEEDWNDEADDFVKVLLPKSKKDRDDVEQYMINAIKEKGLHDVLKYSSILTISKQLAIESFKNQDDNSYMQSNMGKFLDKLVEITQNDAAKIKMATPINRINNMIEQMIGSSDESDSFIGLRQTIIENKKLIKRQMDDLKIEEESILTMIRSESRTKIDAMISEYSSKVAKSGKVVNSSEMSQKITDIISGVADKICQQELSKYLTASSKSVFQRMNKGAFNIPNLEMKTDTIEYTVTTVQRKRRAAKGLRENLSEIFFNTKYYENKERTETRYNHIDLGVNEFEVIAAINSQITAYFTDNIKPLLNDLITMYFEPVLAMQNQLLELIDFTCNKLRNLKSEI